MGLSDRAVKAAEKAQQSMYDLMEAEQLSRQAAAYGWALNAFGEAATDKLERVRRLFEEVTELAQAEGLDQEQCAAILTYTFAKPCGDPKQELGGVMLTSLIYAESVGVSRHEAETMELHRVMSKPAEYWKARHNAKADQGVARRAT